MKLMKRHPTKIVFVALGAYSLLVGKNAQQIVGPDVVQVTIIKKILEYDFEISVVTYGDENNINAEKFNGIKIIKLPAYTYGIRALDIVSKTFFIWLGMYKAKSDIYFNGGGAPGVASIFCKLLRRKYVYRIASDAIVNRKLVAQNVSGFSKSRFSVPSIGNWLDIKLADVIVVQNDYQKTMLRDNFNRNGILIKQGFTITKEEKIEKENPAIVLWVGSMAEVKQPELFVKLAEAIPSAKFRMIGGYSESQKKLHDLINDAAERIPNFEYLGSVPFGKINEHFSRASILVNTSMFEGFPNAFIQAWMHHMPVVSLNADPDKLLSKNKLGFHSESFDQIIADVVLLLCNRSLREDIGNNARLYVEDEHDIDKFIYKYIKIFKS